MSPTCTQHLLRIACTLYVLRYSCNGVVIGEDRKGIDQSRDNKIKFIIVGPWELVAAST